MNTKRASKQTLSVTAVNWLTLFGCIVVAIASWRGSSTSAVHKAPLRSPLAYLPAGARVQAVINLTRLRKSRLGATLTEDGRTLPGVGRLSEVCGFDPSEQVRALGVTVAPSSNARGLDFGIAAIGDFSERRISACARAVIRRRGGVPVQTRIGSFLAVRDENGHGGEIAVRDGGPVLVGAGGYLLAMIDAADGRAPAASGDALHAALQKAIGERGALVVSAVLPADWLERWAGVELARASLLSKVRAVALRLDVAPRVEVHALVGCTATPSCNAARQLLGDLVQGWLTPRLEHALGRRLAHPVRIRAAARDVHVDLVLTQGEAGTLLERVLAELGAFSAPSTDSTARDAAPE
jgi:hypothetical protein